MKRFCLVKLLAMVVLLVVFEGVSVSAEARDVYLQGFRQRTGDRLNNTQHRFRDQFRQRKERSGFSSDRKRGGSGFRSYNNDNYYSNDRRKKNRFSLKSAQKTYKQRGDIWERQARQAEKRIERLSKFDNDPLERGIRRGGNRVGHRFGGF